MPEFRHKPDYSKCCLVFKKSKTFRKIVILTFLIFNAKIWEIVYYFFLIKIKNTFIFSYRCKIFFLHLTMSSIYNQIVLVKLCYQSRCVGAILLIGLLFSIMLYPFCLFKYISHTNFSHFV